MGEQQELLLAAVWESSTDAMRITDFKGKVINVNNAYCILTGFEKEALIGKLFNIVYDKKEQVDLLNIYKKYVASEKTTKRVDERVTFRSGRQSNIESSYSQITMSGKKYVLAIIRDITEFMQAVENNKNSQIELQKSEEKFRTVANYTYDWEYWLSPEEEILFMSPSCERVTGYNHSEFIADKKLHINIVHPDDKKIYKEHLHVDEGGIAAMLDKEEIVFRIINKNGEVRWINHICRLIKSDDGRSLGRRISNRDITVRKLAEEEARKNFELLVNLARSVPGVIYQYRLYSDGHSAFPYSSPGINDIYEVTPEEVREDATPVFGRLHPDDYNHVADAIQESAKTLQTFYCEFRVILPRQGLRWRWSQAFPERMEDGGTLWHGIISDITERKLAEEALLSSQQIIEGIMNAMPVRVFWKDRNLIYLGCNSAFVRDAGFTDPKEIIGKDDFQMGWSEQAELYRSDDLQVIESGRSKLQIEEPQTTPDGKTITLLTNKIPLQNSKGEVNGVLGTYMDITDRKRAEEALKESEERLKLTLDVTNIGIWDWNLKNDKWHTSHTFYTMLGYEPVIDYSDRKLWLDRVHPEDLEEVSKKIQSVLNCENYNYQYEARMKHADGSYRWHNVIGHVIEWDNNKATRLIGVRIDITERKQAEEAQKLFRTLIDQSNDAIEVIDPDTGRFLDANEKAWSNLGYTREEFMNLTISDINPTIDPSSSKKLKDDLLNFGSSVTEGYHKRKDGTTFPVEVNVRYVHLDKGYIITVVRDITERRHIEEKTRLLAHTIKSISEIITITDFEDKFTFVNQAFCDKYGYTYEEVIGKHIKILLSPNNPPDMLKEVTKHSRTEGWKGELLNLTKDGREFPISLKTSKIMNENGEIIGLVGIAEDITERKQIENSLRKSEEKYHSIFESTGTATLIVEEDTTISMANNECFSLTGYSNEELIGTKWTNYVAPESLAEMMKYHSLRRMEPEKAPKKYEVKLRNKKGEIREAILDIGMITDTKQSVVSIIDITDWKHAEAELFQARNDWENTFNTLTDMITIHDENYNIIRSNTAAKTHLGLPELNNLFGSKCFKFYHGIDCPPDGCPSCDCLKTGLPGTFELFEPHLNLYLEIRAIPRFDFNNHLIGLVHVVRDITKRKLAEVDLKTSEEKYRNLIETMPEGFYRSTVEGYFVDVNPALVNILGYDSKEELMKIYIPEDLYFSKSERLEGVAYNNEFTPDTEVYRLKKKDGTEIWIEDHVHYIQDGSGKIIYHEGLMRDVTESLRARNAILEAKDKAEEANKLKSNFLANMSHEIRTPLNGILGFAEILNSELSNPEHLKYTRIIEKSGKRLLDTLHMILTFAKLEAEKQDINYSDVKIENVIEETVQTFEAMAIAKNLYLKSTIKAENITTKSDEKFLIHILNNLVNNAIKFTNTGGITIELSKENNNIFIKVRDTGIGIAKENLEIIFDEFRQESEGFSRSFEGTGLGLSITKQFVEMMNGKISVESEQGIGSVFTVELPYEKFSKSLNIKIEKKESVVEKKKPINESVYKTSILIVEDDEDNRSYIETLLTKFDTDSAIDGLSAINKAKEKTFDLILLDINLGKGMNGLAVIKEIRKMANYKKTPIVALTAFVLYGDKEDFLSAGCTHYLGKPFEREQLLSLIDNITKKV